MLPPAHGDHGGGLTGHGAVLRPLASWAYRRWVVRAANRWFEEKGRQSPPSTWAIKADVLVAGHRVVTLTNGSTEVSDRLFRRAGVREFVDELISAEAAGLWKPALGAYRYGARVCGTDLASMVLVAVHPWDIDGASRAGMRTAWIDRHGAPYPHHFRGPDHTGSELGSVAAAMSDR